ncbi:hypothetical protein BDV32DRAFT_54460 [Aspergillus pseudonomiae]|uniref:Uncharacterized protein n=1 Tax=Aspergillus pseudonomiae TaxID=1506151 RepID=A0A5N6I2E9_9EURO|nr:uncharacterized protein BDV37DRAFT_223188 [Aspergillus pseudonomiae]KAB8259890.1 hypothetical protein BDV32DRAFT_54460 [Aspergillus pseudonomiae]KAE8407823.1 hypothetical protein BDV37DRAFT_223188 [Aspergillus pseudonomiae]
MRVRALGLLLHPYGACACISFLVLFFIFFYYFSLPGLKCLIFPNNPQAADSAVLPRSTHEGTRSTESLQWLLHLNMTGSGASENQKKRRRGLICSKPLGLPESRFGTETGIGHRGLTKIKEA